MTLEQIQALMSLAHAGVQALGVNAFQQVDMASAQGALAELQKMADAEAARLNAEKSTDVDDTEG